MQYPSSPYVKPARHLAAAALAASFAGACATGVDLTQEELATICVEDPTLNCDPTGVAPGGFGGSSSGVAGSTGSGFGGVASGGSFNGSAGTASGTSGSNAGVGGSGGGGGSAPQPLATGACLATDDVVILYRDRSNGAGSTNEPTLVLSVENDGAAFDLPQLTIRYWFTADGAGGFTGDIDYAQLGGAGAEAVSVSFGQELGSDYAELSFSGGGNVATGGVVQEVQLRFHGNPYQDMEQTNDFSFVSPATMFIPNRNITPYVNGVQAGGCVPMP